MDKYIEFVRMFLNRSRTFLRVDINAAKLYVEKYLGNLPAHPEEAHDTMSFLMNYLAEDLVHPDDLWKFDFLKDLKVLVRLCYEEKNGTSLIYRRLEGEKVIWSRIEFLVPEDFEQPGAWMYLWVYDIDYLETAFYDSFTAFSKRILKIARVSLKDLTITVIQEPYSESVMHRKLAIKNYEDEVQHIGKTLIHSEDVQAFYQNFDIKRLKAFFAAGNNEFSYYCRRKISGLYRWIRIIVLPEKEREVYHFYAEDVHRDILKLTDFHNITLHAKHFGGLYQKNIEAYYENLLSVLYGLTQKYVDFYMVDLEKDLYIKYKFLSGTLKRDVPFIASYSQTSIAYINEFCTGEQAMLLSQYATSEKLREAMRDCLTLEYEFYSESGQKLRTICQKVESVRGTPTKILCHTIVVEDENRLYVKTFGNFTLHKVDGTPVKIGSKQTKQLLAYLIDRQGYPVTTKDIVADILEKPESDINAIKYCSTLIKRALVDLEKAGYPNVILKEQKTVRVNIDAVDCDYYHLINGDLSYMAQYHNEYMKEYSWAEETNADIQTIVER